MSTPATIIVKVREKDVGKIKKCDISKINLRTIEMARDLYRTFVKNENEIDEILATSDKVPNKEALATTIKGIKLPQYIEIYHHWDGGTRSLGKELKARFNTYELALNLCLAGSYSTILDGSVPYYSIGRKWGNEGPFKNHSMPDIWCNYQYLFENGKWYVRSLGEKDFKEF